MGAYRQGERPTRRRRALVRFGIGGLAAAAAVLLLLPPARIALPADARDPRVAAGALHLHTTRSDGGGSPDAVAAAASLAGLNFVVFTDHGDGTRAPDRPAWRSGVLALDGVEISTTHGHILAIGMRQSAYRLGGDARDVIEDIARLGGIAVVAHPASPKADLAWTDWDAPFDGAEWLSADSEWRDESWGTLARGALTYMFRPAQSLARILDRPTALLAQLDALAAGQPVLLVAGTDAHGGIGGEGRRRLPVPSYESTLRAMSVRVILRGALGGDADRDASLVLDALRARRVYTAIDALAAPAALTFTGEARGSRAEMGGRLPPGSPVTLRVRANGPSDSTIVLLRDGQSIARSPLPSLEHVSDGGPGVYRVEVHVPDAPGRPPVPWILGNAITVGPPPERPAPEETRVNARVVLFEPGDRSRWMAERDPTSHAAISTSSSEGPLELNYSLGLNEDASPFAAAVRDLPYGLAACETLVFTLSGSHDMRVSVQAREPGGERSEGQRWRRSVFVPADGRTVNLRLASLDAVKGAQRPRASAASLRSLLVVVDTVNSRAGDRGVLRIHRAGCL